MKIKKWLFLFCLSMAVSCCDSSSLPGSSSGTTSGTPTQEGVEDDYATNIPTRIQLDRATYTRIVQLTDIYQRENGKSKRAKIARKLNKEGYRRPDGSKFRARDIPKYLD